MLVNIIKSNYFNRIVPSLKVEISPILKVPKSIIPPPHISNNNYKESNEVSIVKNINDIKNLKYASIIASKALSEVSKKIQKRLINNGDDVDKFIHNFIIRNNCYPSSLGFHGFPKSICISPNDIVCHGIPNKQPFKEGDFINLDLTVYYNGMHSDTSLMITIGEIKVSQNALYKAISICKPNTSFNLIGKIIENYALKNNYFVVKEFCGHGIGKEIHMKPDIIHFDYSDNKNYEKLKMKEGMVFTIEPIICEKRYNNLYLLNDKWAIYSPNNPSSQFEHTILITKKGCEILTKRQDEIIINTKI